MVIVSSMPGRRRLTHVSTRDQEVSIVVSTMMNDTRIRSGLCWFGATCLAVSALRLVLLAMEASAGVGWSLPGYLRLVAAGISLVAMLALMSLAFRIERKQRS